MLEEYLDLDVYQDNKLNNIRKTALILTSLIPLFLLFSRVVADAALTITALLFVIYSIKDKNYAFFKQPIIITLILLWLWFLFGSLFAFDSSYTALSISLVYIRFILFFCACINWIFTDIKAMKFAARIITSTLLLAACDALFQFITDFSISGKPKMGERLTSFLTRPNIGLYLAKLLFPIVSFWLWMEYRSTNKLRLFLTCAFLLFTTSIILMTGERTATALVLSAISLILFIIALNNKTLRLYMGLSIVMIMGAFLFIINNSQFIHKRTLDFISDVGNFSDSLYGQLFKASILVWEKYGFFTGVGLRQFRNACPEFLHSNDVTYCDLHSHNIYLEILSESGIVGLILFGIFVILCLYQVWKSIKLSNDDTDKFISSVFIIGGLFTILFPISVTMSFVANWSATLNWMGISLCISILKLNHKATRHYLGKKNEEEQNV